MTKTTNEQGGRSRTSGANRAHRANGDGRADARHVRASNANRTHRANDGDGTDARRSRSSGVSRARLIAYDVCSEVRQRDAFTRNVLDARLEQEKRLPKEEAAFATTLALGVTQTRGTLDELINRVLENPRDVKPDVRDALRISTYEIIFLDKDAYAAVDQGVKLVEHIRPRAKGVANFALRRIAKLKETFPFGDPDTDLGAFVRSQAFPDWLADLLVSVMGERRARDFMVAANTPAPTFVAVNAAKASDEDVLAVLEEAKAEPEPGCIDGRPVPGCYKLGNSRAIADGRVKKLFNEGMILVSDAASQEIARLAVETAYGSRSRATEGFVDFLEIGSGRATKTILLQSNSKRAHRIFMNMTCVDNVGFKLKLLKERTRTYDVPVKSTVCADGAEIGQTLAACSFDAVFLDAPCTGLGTLRRHPEIRWRIKPQTVAESAEVQERMLAAAAEMVKPGGVLVYSTCTITLEENTRVLQKFLASSLGKRFKLSPIDGKAAFVSTTAPGACDAHFAARLVRLN